MQLSDRQHTLTNLCLWADPEGPESQGLSPTEGLQLASQKQPPQAQSHTVEEGQISDAECGSSEYHLALSLAASGSFSVVLGSFCDGSWQNPRETLE